MSLMKPFDLLEPCSAPLAHGTESEREKGRKRGTQVPLQQDGGGKRTRQTQLFGTALSVLNPMLFSVATPEDGLFLRSITHDEPELVKCNLSFVLRCVLVHKEKACHLGLQMSWKMLLRGRWEGGGWVSGLSSSDMSSELKLYDLRKLGPYVGDYRKHT